MNDDRGGDRLDLWKEIAAYLNRGVSTVQRWEERAFLQTEFDEREAQLSPDGRWIAYTSNQSGRAEVYVRSYPAGDAQWKISLNGGAEPRWRSDGRELFYIGPGRHLMMVAVAADRTFEPGIPAVICDVKVADTYWWDYVPLGDGREFIIEQPAANGSSPLTVVLNWADRLRP